MFFPRVIAKKFVSDILSKKLTPIMLRRRRIVAARRSFWVLFSLLAILVFAGTTGLIQFYQEHIYRGNGSGRGFYVAQDFWVCRLLEWFLGIWIFIVGSCIASFLNVVAYRVPAGLPITGSSFCPYCRVPILPSDNVPVLGWVFLGGRCRVCKISISPRYPIFELIGGLLMLSVYFTTILGHGRNLPWSRSSGLPYGMPVNLHFMDESIFYVAGLHAWLLLFLYAGALTSFGGGRLPSYVWIVGGLAALVAFFLRPEMSILPLGGSEAVSTISYFPNAFLPNAMWQRVLLTSAVGALAGWSLALFWRRCDDRSTWMAASMLIGITLGWQATIWILTISGIGSFLEHVLSKHAQVRLNRVPIRMLWFWTATFLATWHWFPRFFGIL